MPQQNFLTISESFLQNLADNIENADIEANLSVEFHDGILEIIDEAENTYVINQHSATKKIWYSSPHSGADYFAYIEEKWLNKENIELIVKLAAELENFYALKINV